MNIENEKDLQVWLELYKAAIFSGKYDDTPTIHAAFADQALEEYKKRAKALEEALEEDSWIGWHGESCSARYMHPVGEAEVDVVYRDGTKDHGCADEFSWTHLDVGTDIVKFKFA